jgi:predicted RNA-binding protein
MKVRRTARGSDLRAGKIPLFNLNKGGPVPTLEGAKLMWESKDLERKVIIGDFTPKGTLFSQGVLKVEGRIHPGDVVIVGTENELKAFGRALIPGEVMSSDIRGKAVEILSYLK